MPLRRQLPVHSPLGLAALAAGTRALLSARAGLAAEAEVQRRLAERFAGAAVLRTDSGTSALRLALHALGVARTGPVALPAYCCYDIATAADGAGVPVLLYDLDPLTLGPSLPSLAAALEAGAQAVVAVHLYGVPADLGEICRLAEQHRALVVEDAAQGAGMTWEGRPAGATGSLGVLSFGRGKGCTGGGGGALLANDAAGERALAVARHELARASGGGDRLAAAAAQWLLARPSLYGIPASLPFLGLGETMYREPTPPSAPPAATAGILAATWEAAERENRIRRRNGSRLQEHVVAGGGPALAAIQPPDGGEPGWLRLPVLALQDRAALDTPAARRLGIMPGYPQSLADLPGFGERVANRSADFSGARRLAAQLLTLPTHSLLTDRDLAKLEAWVDRTASEAPA